MTNEGFPASFTTKRVQTVQSIINLMFPQNQPFVPLMFFKAPPLSGKTGMAYLLSTALRTRNINAVYLSALLMEEGGTNYLNRVSLGEVVFAKEKGLSPGTHKNWIFV